MKDWFLRFSLRDQLALLALAAALMAYLVFMLLIRPVEESRRELSARNAATAEALGRVDMMAAEVRALRAVGSTGRSSGGRNLTALLNSSADGFQLPISRLQPNSRGGVQLRFEAVSLESLLRWVYHLESAQDILVEDLSISQTSTAGIVGANLRVTARG